MPREQHDLDECWCCGGLHDSFKSLCPACDDAGCKHFGGECQSDHKPVMPDGGRAKDSTRTTQEQPLPKVGEMRRLTGFSWDPWVLVTRVEPDEDGNTVCRFAIMDEMDDDVLTPIPDGLVHGLMDSVGDEAERRELAEIIDQDPDIDKRWCPPYRLDILGGAGIQGVDYGE